ncbi:MAG: hypothetical protein NBV67_13455 [Tagaea sp.]|nr:hypothetical protein [Tagaea sp.]
MKNNQNTKESIVTDDFGGICPIYEAFYIHSIIYVAERSDAAFRRYELAVKEGRIAAFVFAAVQEALTHAGALSRFFWPTPQGNKLAIERGIRLRSAFSVNDTSALKSRTLRNAFEHFDEDLDRYLLKDLTGYIFPTPIVGDYTLTDEKLGHIFKLIDPTHGICVLLGKKFEFRSIQSEVRRVLTAAHDMDQRGCRL